MPIYSKIIISKYSLNYIKLHYIIISYIFSWITEKDDSPIENMDKDEKRFILLSHYNLMALKR